jgi:glycosyltransferase involved in cell wall biosynthesis
MEVFVLPSWSEGLSVTLLEAAASSLPIVAPAVGGNAEVVEYGVSGLLVPPGDATALAEALGTMIEDVEVAADMGRAGRRRFEAEYTVARMAKRYAALYLHCRPQAVGGA